MPQGINGLNNDFWYNDPLIFVEQNFQETEKKFIEIPDEEIPIYNDTEDTSTGKKQNIDFFNYVTLEMETIHSLFLDLTKKIYPLVTKDITKRIFKTSKEIKMLNTYLMCTLWNISRNNKKRLLDMDKDIIINTIEEEQRYFGIHKNINIEMFIKNYNEIVFLFDKYFNVINGRGYIVKRSAEFFTIDIKGTTYQAMF